MELQLCLYPFFEKGRADSLVISVFRSFSWEVMDQRKARKMGKKERTGVFLLEGLSWRKGGSVGFGSFDHFFSDEVSGEWAFSKVR
jgi:hypothetical protein